MHPLKAALSNLKFGDPQAWKGLTMFPLLSDIRSSLQYLVLADGLRDGLVTVKEVSRAGSVPDLAVENRSKLPVLILDGEELAGAKQNRVANLTMLIPAQHTVVIPVSCVEQGRWDYERDDFVVTEQLQYARGRTERLASVLNSLAETGERVSDQAQVWHSIAAKAATMDAASPSRAMSSIFERHAATLDQYVESVNALPGQVGAVFMVGRERLGLDVFDQPETFALMLPRLVRSYAVDVIERPISQKRSARVTEARSFLGVILKASFEDRPALGLGRDLGCVAENLVAGALLVDEVVVHLAAFSGSRSTRTEPGSARRPAIYR
ncbi:MAG: hypothetical protein F4X19_02575 [Acidobacteria bacterium]|nr:hypothetical protein [Acidobacteriota bacterium]